MTGTRNIFESPSYLRMLSALTIALVSLTAAEELISDQQTQSRKLIVGGSLAPSDSYPWLAQAYGGCGASLVTPEFVLTSAHCRGRFSSLKIGAKCRNHENQDGQNCGQYSEIMHRAANYIHPLYTNINGNVQNDLMLVQLSQPSTITPVKMDLGTLSDGYEDGRPNLWTAGFGLIERYPDIISNTLNHLETKYVSSSECIDMYSNQQTFQSIETNMICAQNDDPTKSACFGDGGGPLFDTAEQKLVGVLSTGPNMCNQVETEQIPVLYSRISSHADWIKDTICEKSVHGKPVFCSTVPNPPSTSTKAPSSTKAPISTKAPAISPTVSPTVPRMPQDTYFKIVSKVFDPTGKDWCLSPMETEDNSIVTAVPCTNGPEEDLQLWKYDDYGNLQNRNDDSLCMKYLQEEKMFRVRKCYANPVFAFVFDGISKDLIWLKSMADFRTWGLRAVSIRKGAADSINNASSLGLCMKRRDFKDDLQKWTIVYPNLPLDFTAKMDTQLDTSAYSAY